MVTKSCSGVREGRECRMEIGELYYARSHLFSNATQGFDQFNHVFYSSQDFLFDESLEQRINVSKLFMYK